MSLIERIHNGAVYGRRVRVLCDLLAESLPPNAKVLDVGCGDGLIDHLIMQKRPDVSIRGIDVLVRPELHITVEKFDGAEIPYEDDSFDIVMFVDVLHHTNDPMVMLREASRVARQGLLIKDHDRSGFLGESTLKFMDWVGNARHGVSLPYNYWTKDEWLDAFGALGLVAETWKKSLSLYPWWADLVFGRSLHFIALLGKSAPPVDGREPRSDAPARADGGPDPTTDSSGGPEQADREQTQQQGEPVEHARSDPAAAGRDVRSAARTAVAARLAVGAVLLVIAARGVWNIAQKSEAYYNNDAPRHIMTAIFWHDMYRVRPVSDPVGFAHAYYGHYPAICPLHWPPLLHMTTALVFLPFGPSVTAARVVILLVTLGMYLATYATARRALPPGPAAAAVALLATATILMPFQTFFMLEIPCILLMLLAARAMLGFIETTKARQVWFCAAFATAAMLTKQHGVTVWPALGAMAVAGFGRRHWRSGHLWAAVTLAVAVTTGYYLYALSYITSSGADVATSSGSALWSLWGFAAGAGPLVVLAAIGGGVVACLKHRRDPFCVGMVVWVLSVVALFMVVGIKDSRYLIYALPPMAMLAARLLSDLSGRTAAWARVVFCLLLAGMVGRNVLQRPLPTLRGYEEAAIWANQASANGVVVFGGRRGGTFVLYRRLHDPQLNTITYRADKLVGCGKGLAGRNYQTFVESEAEIRSLLAEKGPGAVVLENEVDIDMPEHHWFWNVIRTDLQRNGVVTVSNTSQRMSQLEQYRMHTTTVPPSPSSIPVQTRQGYVLLDPTTSLWDFGR